MTADLLRLSPSGASAHLTELAAAKDPDSRQQLSHTVLRWQRSTSSPLGLLSEDSLQSMHRLVKRIAHLRSTPDRAAYVSATALLPQVEQEAQDVLTQWVALARSGAAPKQPVSETTQSLKLLTAWLLWSIAQSTHEALGLIEGVAAQFHPAEPQQWQTGILRLAVILELKDAQSNSAFDLVTLQPAASSLLTEGQVQLQNSLLGQSMTVSALLQQLTTQIVTTEPVLQSFLDGFPGDWLMPLQDWRSGLVKLHLGLEFMPVGAAWSLNEGQPPQPMVKFTHPAWLEQHVTSAVEHQLTQTLLQTPLPLEAIAQPNTEALTAVIETGCAAMDVLQCSLMLASRTFAQQPLPLNELALRLLWNVNRTAYEVMQLTSGVRVKLLQPQQGWLTGMLRWAVQVSIRTPEQDWQFDLVRRSLVTDLPAPVSTAVVQSCEHQWCFQPRLLNDLAAELWRQLEQNAPELALLRAGTEISILVEASADAQWELGVIQLDAAFEFIPDSRTSLLEI